MLILEKPYISDLLINLAIENNIPVLRNAETENLSRKGYFLNLLSSEDFASVYELKKKIYMTSENALEWVYSNIKNLDLLEKINFLKDKSLFREVCKNIYPDYFFKRVSYSQLFKLDVSEFHFPFVLKPVVGFLSVGVYVIRNFNDWNKAVNDLKCNFEMRSADFPSAVIDDKNFLIEEYISGDEFAVDAYFNSEGNPVILNIFHHLFASESDVSDRIYCSSKDIYDKYLNEFENFLLNLNSLLGLKDFPIHIEFRYNGEKAIPIEINPMRFAGFCLNELQLHIGGIHPVESFFKGLVPDYEKMWQGKENEVFSFVVFERPSNSGNVKIDRCALAKIFSDILETREYADPSIGILATLFIKTDKSHLHELNDALKLNVKHIIINK